MDHTKLANLNKAVALLQAGDWQGAHAIVQEEEDSPLASWAHGIVHVLEGDQQNARYWYRRAKRTFPEPFSRETELQALATAVRKASLDKKRAYPR